MTQPSPGSNGQSKHSDKLVLTQTQPFTQPYMDSSAFAIPYEPICHITQDEAL